VAIFTHGLFMRTLLWVQLADPVEIDAAIMRRYHSFISGFSAPNGSILKLHIDGERDLFFGHFITAHLADVL